MQRYEIWWLLRNVGSREREPDEPRERSVEPGRASPSRTLSHSKHRTQNESAVLAVSHRFYLREDAWPENARRLGWWRVERKGRKGSVHLRAECRHTGCFASQRAIGAKPIGISGSLEIAFHEHAASMPLRRQDASLAHALLWFLAFGAGTASAYILRLVLVTGICDKVESAPTRPTRAGRHASTRPDTSITVNAAFAAISLNIKQRGGDSWPRLLKSQLKLTS